MQTGLTFWYQLTKAIQEQWPLNEPCTTSGQKTELVYSYNPGALMGQLQMLVLQEVEPHQSLYRSSQPTPSVTSY